MRFFFFITEGICQSWYFLAHGFSIIFITTCVSQNKNSIKLWAKENQDQSPSWHQCFGLCRSLSGARRNTGASCPAGFVKCGVLDAVLQRLHLPTWPISRPERYSLPVCPQWWWGMLPAPLCYMANHITMVSWESHWAPVNGCGGLVEGLVSAVTPYTLVVWKQTQHQGPVQGRWLRMWGLDGYHCLGLLWANFAPTLEVGGAGEQRGELLMEDKEPPRFP